MRTTLAAAALGLAATAGWLTARRTYRTRLADARHSATHDPLTGALNRAGLLADADRFIDAAAREHRPVVVALVDLVGFKQVNDTYGHDAGDHILTTIAARLAGIAGPAGLTCRLGGDEFVVVTTGTPSRQADADVWLAGWLPHIHARLTTPVTYQGQPLAVGATIGGTLAGPGQPVGVWLSTADRAMYAAREQRTTTAIALPATQSPASRPGVRVRELARPTSRLAAVRLAA